MPANVPETPQTIAVSSIREEQGNSADANATPQGAPLLKLETYTSTTSLPPPLPSSAPNTPKSPLLPPIESAGLPLVSPLLTSEQTLNQDHILNVNVQESRANFENASLSPEDGPEKISEKISSDPGLDGIVLSQPSSEIGYHVENEVAGESRQFFGDRYDGQVDSLPLDWEEESSPRKKPSNLERSDPLEPSQAKIFTTNSKLLHHEAREDQQNLGNVSFGPPEEELKHVVRVGQGGNWQVRDVFEEFLIQSPVEQEVTIEDPTKKILSTTIDSIPPLLPRRPISENGDQESRKQAGTEPTPPSSQLKKSEPHPKRTTSLHRVDQILDQPLPLTPAQTSLDLGGMLIDEQEHTSPPPDTQIHIPERSEDLMDRQPETINETPLKVPAVPPSNAATTIRRGTRMRRKSEKVRANDVPDVISPWFSSRKKSRRKSRVTENVNEEVRESPSIRRNRHQLEEPQKELGHELRYPPFNGLQGTFQTPSAIYQPLASLEKFLGQSDSQGPKATDVLAVITSVISEPHESRSGPKDWNTTFEISDASIDPDSVEVQCFRPYASSLPEAGGGDVILLRDFVVKTSKRRCFLLSAGSSSWLVWRFSKADGDATASVPSENTRALTGSDQYVIPECRGPPVEFGREEKQHALQLRRWWLSVPVAKGKERVGDTNAASKL